MQSDTLHDGVLIIGAGLAGLYTALSLAPRPVTIITAGQLVGKGSASAWAQGGLAAAMAQDDSAADHASDTVNAGAGLVDVEAANILCTEGPSCISHLADLGVPFDRSKDGQYRLGREAAHGRDRIVHVGGDEAGSAIMQVLTKRALAAEHITIFENMVAYRLITDENGVRGAALWDIKNQCHRAINATQTVLATGGIGGLFAVTTNPLAAQGNGLAMAYEVGATLRDLEFVQFHPTGLDIGRDPAPLATEALRGAGASLRDAHGRAFMNALHKDGDLAPRDVVARCVANAIAQTGQVFLDAREAIGASFKARFPTVYTACMAAGIDPVIIPIPVAPAAHYHMGGIRTDIDGRTDIEGLWAVGEVASTGVHGANRLASNSLLEALVFGARTGRRLLNTEYTAPKSLAPPCPSHLTPNKAQSATLLRRAMTDHCGLLRDKDGLNSLIEKIEASEAVTTGDALTLSAMGLIARAALARQESRGAHQRHDFPDLLPPDHSVTKRSMPALCESLQNDCTS